MKDNEERLSLFLFKYDVWNWFNCRDVLFFRIWFLYMEVCLDWVFNDFPRTLLLFIFERVRERATGGTMNKIHKIGRYYYEQIPLDEHGEPKLLQSDEDENIFTLVDYDGEPIKVFRRCRKEVKSG